MFGEVFDLILTSRVTELYLSMVVKELGCIPQIFPNFTPWVQSKVSCFWPVIQLFV